MRIALAAAAALAAASAASIRDDVEMRVASPDDERAYRERERAAAQRERVRRPTGRCFANVGRNHPDYGLSPQEHAARKAARERGEA